MRIMRVKALHFFKSVQIIQRNLGDWLFNLYVTKSALRVTVLGNHCPIGSEERGV